MSVGAVNKQTGDRIPTAGMPAIDNALSLSSTNPVQNAIITAALAGKQATLTFDDAPTANSNNPVKSGGVKSAIDAAVASAYHHAGTKTCAELVAGLLVAGNEGNVYNMTDSGTTTADFIDGAGQPIKAGDNVGIAKISDGVYKFDLLSGFVDTSNFVQKSVTAGLLKNDGTVNTTIEGDVDSLKSGLTNLSNNTEASIGYEGRNLVDPSDFRYNSSKVNVSVNGAEITIVVDGTSEYQDVSIGSRTDLTFKPGKYYIKFRLKSISNTSVFNGIGFRDSNNALGTQYIELTNTGEYEEILEISNDRYFSMVLNGDEAGDRSNTVVIENLIVSLVDMDYVAPTKSINARLEAVESGKQDKTDNALTTTDKTVVGAINELDNDISTLGNKVVLSGNAESIRAWTNDSFAVISVYGQTNYFTVQIAADGTVTGSVAPLNP